MHTKLDPFASKLKGYLAILQSFFTQGIHKGEKQTNKQKQAKDKTMAVLIFWVLFSSFPSPIHQVRYKYFSLNICFHIKEKDCVWHQQQHNKPPSHRSQKKNPLCTIHSISHISSIRRNIYISYHFKHVHNS